MAKVSLATTPLSHNDINCLAQLFTGAFLSLNKNPLETSVMPRKNFLRQVDTVVGLAFTATLADQEFLALFKPYLDDFLNYPPSSNEPKAHEKWGIAVADMISLGSDAFRMLKHPGYYRYFLKALQISLRYLWIELNIPLSHQMETLMKLIEADAPLDWSE